MDLHSTAGTIQWVTTGFLLAMAVAIPVTGWAEHRWGGKRVGTAALMLFVLASALCAAPSDDISLTGFRALEGFGAGLIFPLMQKLAVRAAGGRISSRLMAAVSLPIALAPILGPVIGGVILYWLTWRWLFLVNAPLIAAGLLLAWRFLPTDRPERGAVRTRLDWIGPVAPHAVTGGCAARPLTTVRGRRDHPSPRYSCHSSWAPRCSRPSSAGRHAGERRPIVARLLRLRSLCSVSAALFTAGAAMYAGVFLLPLYYQQLRDEIVFRAGLLLTPQGVGALAARFMIGAVVDRFGARAVTIAGLLLAAIATAPFALAGPATNLWWLGTALVLRGLGIGAVLIPRMSVAYQDVQPSGIPDATMNTRIVQQVGGSCGTAIVAVVLQSLLAQGATGAFQGAFWWAMGITAAALVPAIALPTSRRPSPE